MKKTLLTLCLLLIGFTALAANSNPVERLVDRIDAGASKKFIFELVDPQSETDYFELDNKGGKIWIKGNNWVSVATGLNWYLKYHAGVNISWNNFSQRLNNLPKVKSPERLSTDMLVRYYLNYCTFSYSMSFWDWKRWEQEIDWMALHGINLPLAVNGTATVWRNTMIRLGYNQAEIDKFIAGPGHQAWWLMNNLEGWGGPNPESWYEGQVKLERQIVARYKEWGIEPVFVGYCGMVPSGSDVKLGLNVQNPGKWVAYNRPAFLQPTDPKFPEIAAVYYEELEKLFGKANYYAMDPFHEGGSVAGVDLTATGTAIFDAMKKASEGAKWVIQAWQNCPYPQMINHLPAGEVIVLDLFSESRPQWGDVQSTWYRPDGYGPHDWVYCMLLNFGGNVGMFGKMQRVINGYYLAQTEPVGRHLVGVGATMEGIENNPVMYELIYELPWRKEKFTKEDWLKDWVVARYGNFSQEAYDAWKIIANTAYEAPYESVQEGTTESVLCGRPALVIDRVSTWGGAKMYYDGKEFEKALFLLNSVASKYRGSNNFEYDLVDIARQAIANKANVMLKEMAVAFDKNDSLRYEGLSKDFLGLILMQDRLLSSRKEFMVGPWISQAMMNGKGEEEMEFFRWNARTLITTWGNREAANFGLRDYAHREWSGILKDLYYKRWKHFFDYVNTYKRLPVDYDYYDMEYQWTIGRNPYPVNPTSDAIIEAAAVGSYLKTSAE